MRGSRERPTLLFYTPISISVRVPVRISVGVRILRSSAFAM